MIKEGIVTVLLTTSLGEIKIELNKELAPITTQNFVKYVESGFYDQTIFHRVIENFVIQGGGHNEDMSMKDKDLEPIQNEANNINDIAKNLDINSDTFKFSFTLDDFARSFGDTYNLDINNYADLTDLANAQHNANWSVEEYAAAYQDLSLIHI